jgi:hypothetical protein
VRSTPVVVGLLIVVGLLWIGGELHRSNCIRQGRVACSVLPWDQGTTKARQIQQRRRGGGVVYSDANRGSYGNPGSYGSGG